MLKVFEAYCKDVRESKFPGAEHTYTMMTGELEKLMAVRKK